MKIAAISDTHHMHSLIPDFPTADVFVHAGDFMNTGIRKNELEDFVSWIDKIPLPKERKLVIAGNHDIMFDYTHPMSSPNTCVKAETKLKAVCTYLNEQEVVIDGIKFFGSAWTPRFFNWAFNADRGADIKTHWDKIPEDVQVLVTHGPPIGILDQVVPEEHPSPIFPHLGCEDLSHKLSKLKQLKHHVFGHIHGSRGQKTIHNVTYTNPSFLTELYKPFPNSGYFILEV